MKTIDTVPNQTIYDLAAKYYGTPDAVAEIAENNPHLLNDLDAREKLGLTIENEHSEFFFDLPIRPGTRVAIDPDSKLSKPHVVKEISNYEITTFDL